MKKILLENKEIFEMKLTITTNCLLRCNYCFVKKLPEMMDYDTAKATVDFFLKFGRKNNKILKIYGGEPLLNFELLKKIIPYIIRNIPFNNNLTLSLCTNAVLLKPEHIDFFKKYNFQLAISLDGKKETHDRFRKFRNGKGSFDIIVKNLALLFQNIKKENIAANIGIVPSEVKKLFENYQYIISLGFDTVNFEPIYGFGIWDKKNQKEFEKQMERIIDFILKGIHKNQFLFLTTINRELKYKTLSKLKSGVCLFHQFLEVYPDGRIGFSSFFLNLPKKIQKKYIIGNVAEGKLRDRYRNCFYSKNNPKCQICLSDYFDISDESMAPKVVEIRNKFSLNLANQIQKKAKIQPIFKKYIQEAKNHICF